MTLKVVENLHQDSKPHIASLYDRLNEVIQDHCANSGQIVTGAEVVGTLELLKLAQAGVYNK